METITSLCDILPFHWWGRQHPWVNHIQRNNKALCDWQNRPSLLSKEWHTHFTIWVFQCVTAIWPVFYCFKGLSVIYSVEPKNINLYSFLFNYIFTLKTVDDRGQCEGKCIQTDYTHLCKYIHSCWTDHSCLEKFNIRHNPNTHAEVHNIK